MTIVRCVSVAMVIALMAIPAARAEDPGVKSSNDLRVSPSTDQLPRQVDTTVTGQSSTDSTSTVDDLEATRAAIDRRNGPAISLTVSGWVAEQVIRTH